MGSCLGSTISGLHGLSSQVRELSNGARYILDRKQAFPDNPLPSSSWARKTFDSCVADPHDMECKYPQGSFGGFEDHRRQSIFFCGHHQDCVPFNSERANQLAKRVVEEHYAV